MAKDPKIAVSKKDGMWIASCRIPTIYGTVIVRACTPEAPIKQAVLKELENRPGWGFGDLWSGVKKIGNKIGISKVVHAVKKGIGKLGPLAKLADPGSWAIKELEKAGIPVDKILAKSGIPIVQQIAQGREWAKSLGLPTDLGSVVDWAHGGDSKKKAKALELVKMIAQKAKSGSPQASLALKHIRAANSLIVHGDTNVPASPVGPTAAQQSRTPVLIHMEKGKVEVGAWLLPSKDVVNSVGWALVGRPQLNIEQVDIAGISGFAGLYDKGFSTGF